MKYRHLNTGVIAELLNTLEGSVELKNVETGEIKTVKNAPFARWWKPYEEEIAAENESDEIENEEIQTEENPAEAEPEVSELEEEEKPLALSEIVSKLENLFDMLNGQYFDSKLPRPIITVQSTPQFYGHCSTKKIWKRGADNENEGQYEINIGAEFLNRPSEETASTMLHEMVHLHCRENDLKETCQNGRYHNKLFKEECESRGLIVDYDRTNGYAYTKPSESLIGSLRANGYALNIPFARHTIKKEKKAAQRNKTLKYVCPVCGQTVRSAQDLNLICGNCQLPMERLD